jgi:hypothetical protein
MSRTVQKKIFAVFGLLAEGFLLVPLTLSWFFGDRWVSTDWVKFAGVLILIFFLQLNSRALLRIFVSPLTSPYRNRVVALLICLVYAGIGGVILHRTSHSYLVAITLVWITIECFSAIFDPSGFVSNKQKRELLTDYLLFIGIGMFAFIFSFPRFAITDDLLSAALGVSPSTDRIGEFTATLFIWCVLYLWSTWIIQACREILGRRPLQWLLDRD